MARLPCAVGPSSSARAVSVVAGRVSRVAQPDDLSSHRTSGLVYAISAYVLWGILPIYLLALAPASAWEIVAWRVIFSLAFCAIALTVTRSWGRFGALLRDRRVL